MVATEAKLIKSNSEPSASITSSIKSCIYDNPYCTSVDICVILGIPFEEIEGYINYLVGAGQVERRKSWFFAKRKKVYYELTSAGKSSIGIVRFG